MKTQDGKDNDMIMIALRRKVEMWIEQRMSPKAKKRDELLRFREVFRNALPEPTPRFEGMYAPTSVRTGICTANLQNNPAGHTFP